MAAPSLLSGQLSSLLAEMMPQCSMPGGSAAQEPSPAWCQPLWSIQPSKLSSQ